MSQLIPIKRGMFPKRSDRLAINILDPIHDYEDLMVVQKLEIDGYNNIILEARMDSDQVWVAKDRAPKIYKT